MQSLESKIEIEQKGQSIRLEGEYLNEIINSRGQLGLNVVTGWETPKWKFNLSAPFDVFYFDAEQQGNKILDKARSDEHKSELQSLMRISYAVFCLKHKKKIKHKHST